MGAKICDLLAQGKSLRAICEMPGMPSRSCVVDWVDGNKEFAVHYARARDKGLDALADEILTIADTPQAGIITKEGGVNGDITETRDMIEHRRLQVDTRKWYVSKLAPKRYGDRLAVEHSGDVSIVERLNAGRKRTNT